MVDLTSQLEWGPRADRGAGGSAGALLDQFLSADVGGLDRGQDQAAGGSFVAGAVGRLQSRRAAVPCGVGAGIGD